MCQSQCKEGYWTHGDMKSRICIINGNELQVKNTISLDYPDITSIMAMTLEYGDFGDAKKEIAQATGSKAYNVKLKGWLYSFKAVLNDEGTKMNIWGFANKMEVWEWITPERLEQIKQDRDDAEAPRCGHIAPAPERQGKIYWLSGPPGAGKSTTCQLMARQKSFIYYEADCMAHLTNPFIDVHVDDSELTMSCMTSKPLRGMTKEAAEAVLQSGTLLRESWTQGGKNYDVNARPLLQAITDDVKKQKSRIGGDFAVAHTVPTRASRDFIREELGNEVIFILLNLTVECQTERLIRRHGKETEGIAEIMRQVHKLTEAAEIDEPNAINVTIEVDDTRQSVLEKVLKHATLTT